MKGKENGLQNQTDVVRLPTPTFVGHVIQGKLRNFAASVSSFVKCRQ